MIEGNFDIADVKAINNAALGNKGFMVSGEMTLDEAREWNDETQDEVAGLIDSAQGEIHMGNQEVAYVVIKIIKG